MKINYINGKDMKIGDIFPAFDGGDSIQLFKVAALDSNELCLEVFTKDKEKFLPYKKLSVNGKFIVISE